MRVATSQIKLKLSCKLWRSLVCKSKNGCNEVAECDLLVSNVPWAWIAVFVVGGFVEASGVVKELSSDCGFIIWLEIGFYWWVN